MILGTKGSGVTTQIRMLCERYKLEELSLKDAFLGKMQSEKETRKRRRLLDRGFRPPPAVEEEGEEPPPDAEIEEDPEDFDREAHERDLLKMVGPSQQGLVIDGSWRWTGDREKGEADHAEAVTAVDGGAFATLLAESRRAPEFVIELRCKEPAAFERMIDAEATKAEYERLMKERAEGRTKQREEDRAAKVTEVEEAAHEGAATEENPEGKQPDEIQAEIQENMTKWDEDRDAEEEAFEEEDPDKPNLEEMLEKHREVIRTTREADEGFLEEFGTQMKEKGVPFVEIKTDTSAEFVFIKLVDKLKAHLQMRPDLLER
jgi:hypothetical protein